MKVIPEVESCQEELDNYSSKIEALEDHRQEVSTMHQVLVDQTEELSNRITELEELVSTPNGDVQIMQGVIQKQDRQIILLQESTMDLKGRALRNQVIVTGIENDGAGENVPASAREFIKAKLKMDIKDEDVEFANRQGINKSAKPRPMVFGCSGTLRSEIFSNVSHLRGVKNSFNDLYYITQNLPEQYAAESKEVMYKVKKIKDKNKTAERKANQVCYTRSIIVRQQ